MTDNPVVNLDAVREHREQYKASHAHEGSFACCTAHACAEDVPPLIAEIERLRERLNAAHEALAIDEFDGDSCNTLEETIAYAVSRYRLVCDAEAEAADEIRRLRAEVPR
jgi:hypothetical protein